MMRVLALVAILALPGCVVATVVDTAVGVTATAVETTVDVGSAVVGGTVDIIAGDDDADDEAAPTE